MSVLDEIKIKTLIEEVKQLRTLLFEAACELARLRRVEAAARSFLEKFCFAVVLNGETGFGHLRCKECGGTNEGLVKNEMASHNVRHENDCQLAAALREAVQSTSSEAETEPK